RQLPRRTLAWMYGVVALLNLAGWLTLVAFVVPGHFYVPQQGVFGVGLGVLAFTFGLRHAFDADHIAAIDNTTRKLLEERGGRPPVSVGFWFSLGHSTVVVVMVGLIAFGVHTLAGAVSDQDSFLERNAGLFGASVSGVFLVLLGVLNLVVLLGIIGVFRRLRHGEYDEAELEAQLARRGLMNRFFGGLMRFVRRPVHIYPIGVLFGFGFDTVTEVALLAVAGAAAASALPWYAVLVLPVLFTAGMALMDTSDGVFMNSAYGWAFAKPIRKIFYNMVVTTVSVIVALVIGVIEAISVIADGANLTGGGARRHRRHRPELCRVRHRRGLHPRLGRRPRRLAPWPDRGPLDHLYPPHQRHCPRRIGPPKKPNPSTTAGIPPEQHHRGRHLGCVSKPCLMSFLMGPWCMAIGAGVESSLRAKFEVVLPHLDERSARLVLAGEARSGAPRVFRTTGPAAGHAATCWFRYSVRTSCGVL
ncbi:MAG: HoxN/HupN/NixA family nickel/cobalt transporter, partial [Nocardioidaceae bacterium]